MQLLQPALFAEGPSDHRFLTPLIFRLCEALCMASQSPVEVAPVLPLKPLPGDIREPRARKIANAASEAREAWNVLFIHADADTSGQRARSERVQPAIDEIRLRLKGSRHQTVPVVPVKEMEAWAICDGDALRIAFGVNLTDRQLGVPLRAQDVETISDPKLALEASFTATCPNRKNARRGVAPYLGLIGEEIAIPRLQQVAAFVAFERELKSALVALSLLPG